MQNELIKAFKDSPCTETAAELIMQFQSDPSHELIAELAETLAASGNRLTFSEVTGDIPSTGGASSLSTLLCPLFLSLAGFLVPKLGIQGRPAGGIDVMSQIQGFQISPPPDRIREILTECKFAHFIANEKYTPLDRLLFQIRQKLGAQNLAGLVVASILSKKVAIGVKFVGLDLRMFPGGNFGGTVAAATTNAKLFIAVATLLGIKSECYISDASIPYQPYIGRGEALIALYEILLGKPQLWLLKHVEECLSWANSLAAKAGLTEVKYFSQTSLLEAFTRHLKSQGSSLAQFQDAVKEIKQKNRFIVESPANGYVRYDLEKIRAIIVEQQQRDKSQEFADPTGMILLKHPNENVVKGEPILSIRAKDPPPLKKLAAELFSITSHTETPFQSSIISNIDA